MLEIRKITLDSPDFSEAKRLYEDSFPANERRAFEPLVTDATGHAETLGFYDGGAFVGFASLLLVGDIAHIIYFATEEKLRGRGCGSSALAAMHARYDGSRVIVDVERERVGAENNEIRRRRRAFYLRNGYEPTQVRYNWRGDDYEILSHGGDVSGEEFGNFYRTLDNETECLAEY